MQGTWVQPSVGQIPWRRKRQPTPIFLFGEFHGQSSPVSYRPWGPKTIGQDLVTKWHQWTSCCSVIKLCPSLSNPMDCSTPGFLAFHHLHQFAQAHVLWADDAIQPSHSLLSPSTLAFNLSLSTIEKIVITLSLLIVLGLAFIITHMYWSYYSILKNRDITLPTSCWKFIYLKVTRPGLAS